MTSGRGSGAELSGAGLSGFAAAPDRSCAPGPVPRGSAFGDNGRDGRPGSPLLDVVRVPDEPPPEELASGDPPLRDLTSGDGSGTVACASGCGATGPGRTGASSCRRVCSDSSGSPGGCPGDGTEAPAGVSCDTGDSAGKRYTFTSVNTQILRATITATAAMTGRIGFTQSSTTTFTLGDAQPYCRLSRGAEKHVQRARWKVTAPTRPVRRGRCPVNCGQSIDQNREEEAHDDLADRRDRTRFRGRHH